MYESRLRFPGDILGEFERLQREMEQVFGGVGRPVSIHALGRGAFPAITIGNRPDPLGERRAARRIVRQRKLLV